MSETKKPEELNKSIDALIEELFYEETPKKEEVEKSIDIAKDSEKTADQATKKAPKWEKDEARGAGRPQQISDVPQNDQDGKRESEYDDEISMNENKEMEPDEAKKQVAAIDQSSEKGRMSSKPKAPEMKPFKKSEEDETEALEITEDEWKEFQEFRKSKAEAEAKKAKEEELKKADKEREEFESLVKSAVEAQVSSIKQENEELKKSVSESLELLKSMANAPRTPKSVTNIQALEKSFSEEGSEPESFTKSEILDKAEELVKSGKIPSDVVYEYEMTGNIYNEEYRKVIEKALQGK